MNGLWLLFLLIFISALPIIPAWFWFRRGTSAPRGGFRSFKSGSHKFLFSIAAGLVSVLVAILIQSLFPPPGTGAGSPGSVLFGIFIRIALVEELSRILTLGPLIGVYRRKLRVQESKLPGADGIRPSGFDDDSRFAGGFMASAMGLAAGLGFAVVESALYAAASPGIALLRAFTAAPLHGACGARVGASIGFVRSRPFHSAVLFVTAVLIHGMYDFFIIYPGIPSFLSVFIALSALGASILTLRYEENKGFNR
jgi:RsiW-degrading membrane proteinase PrsW (M82 family)